MVLGPGPIVMEADNDAGAVSTYMPAGGQYGLHLLWSSIVLLPICNFVQEMVARLGIATGKGHVAFDGGRRFHAELVRSCSHDGISDAVVPKPARSEWSRCRVRSRFARMSTRPPETGDLARNSRGHSDSGFALASGYSASALF